MYREIVTQAVIGKGNINNNKEIVISPEVSPSKVLGCWIINHYHICSIENNCVFAKGKYDVHVWYGIKEDTDTIVHKQTIEYDDKFDLKMKDNILPSEENELISRCIKYPTCSNLSLDNENNICVVVDKQILLDVVGETKLKVQVSSDSNEQWNMEDVINVDYINKKQWINILSAVEDTLLMELL